MGPRRHLPNSVIPWVVMAGSLFFALYSLSPTKELIVALNGVFAGTMAAVAVAYWRLLWNAVLGIPPFDRVRQMTLGFALCWLAYLIGAATYFIPADENSGLPLLTAASRYVAIIAAVLQVTAPDFGLGLFHGTDRKVLVTGVIIGLAVAILVIIPQS